VDKISDVITNVEGFMHKEECRAIYDLAKQTNGDACIVEIGSHKGRSSCCLGLGSLAGNKAKIYCIDLWQDYLTYPESSEWGRKVFTSPKVFEKFQDNLKKYDLSEIIEFIQGESTLVAKKWRSPIGLLLIDGNHNYEGVRDDFGCWSPFLTPDAVVLFHDYSSAYNGVVQFVDGLTENGKI
jgi:predicted O-methyltransferase YrrM